MKRHSTPEVAKLLGIAQPNLQRAISEGRVKAPPIEKVGGIRVRLWTQGKSQPRERNSGMTNEKSIHVGKKQQDGRLYRRPGSPFIWLRLSSRCPDPRQLGNSGREKKLPRSSRREPRKSLPASMPIN